MIIPILVLSGLACSSLSDNPKANDKPVNDTKPAVESKPPVNMVKPAKLDAYSIRGIKIAYFEIPAGLKEKELVETAQKLHEQEPDTQLILVDDDSQIADYINYAKALSGIGKIDKPMPVDWADKHVVANIQKNPSGKFVICEGYGSKAIAELK